KKDVERIDGIMTFGATMNRQDQKTLSAATTAFAAALIWTFDFAAVRFSAATNAMSAILTKITAIVIAAATAPMSGAIMRGRLFAAATVAQGATITRTMFNALDAAMATFSVTFSGVHAIVVSISAATAAMSAAISKQINKLFNAS
ncbi:MAG TPA: hypothetical protein VFK30_09280, partial [Anaerolineae bacterium]|nr:hypothetical protein [Anaerolineae bacterium]